MTWGSSLVGSPGKIEVTGGNAGRRNWEEFVAESLLSGKSGTRGGSNGARRPAASGQGGWRIRVQRGRNKGVGQRRKAETPSCGNHRAGGVLNR